MLTKGVFRGSEDKAGRLLESRTASLVPSVTSGESLHSLQLSGLLVAWILHSSDHLCSYDLTAAGQCGQWEAWDLKAEVKLLAPNPQGPEPSPGEDSQQEHAEGRLKVPSALCGGSQAMSTAIVPTPACRAAGASARRVDGIFLHS